MTGHYLAASPARVKKPVLRTPDERVIVYVFIDYVKTIYEQHKLYDWNVTIDRSLTRAGLCIYDKKTISFSVHLILNQEISWNQKHTVILHEVAHALVGFAAGHGDIWKNKCLEIGGDGQRFHTLLLKTPRATATCVCGIAHIHRMTKKWDTPQQCRKCNNIVIVTKVI
jgi:hypothetical protein